MSWDVMVFNVEGELPDLDQMQEEWVPGVLGDADDVRSRISAVLEGTDWSDPAWGSWGTEEFSFEFNIGGEPEVDSMMVHVRGGGDAVMYLLKMSEANGWSLMDTSDGRWIDPSNPDDTCFADWQAFRDKVTGSREESEDSD